MKEFMKKWGMTILASVFLLLYLGRGCTNSKIADVNDNIENAKQEQTAIIDSLKNEIIILKEMSFSQKDVRDEMERVMLDFLIYEDDLDHGKTSLSTVKDKIESND